MYKGKNWNFKSIYSLYNITPRQGKFYEYSKNFMNANWFSCVFKENKWLEGKVLYTSAKIYFHFSFFWKDTFYIWDDDILFMKEFWFYIYLFATN